jgi:hypothetical protein
LEDALDQSGEYGMNEMQIETTTTLETHLSLITTMRQTQSCDLEITHRAYTDAEIPACLKALKSREVE